MNYSRSLHSFSSGKIGEIPIKRITWFRDIHVQTHHVVHYIFLSAAERFSSGHTHSISSRFRTTWGTGRLGAAKRPSLRTLGGARGDGVTGNTAQRPLTGALRLADSAASSPTDRSSLHCSRAHRSPRIPVSSVRAGTHWESLHIPSLPSLHRPCLLPPRVRTRQGSHDGAPSIHPPEGSCLVGSVARSPLPCPRPCRPGRQSQRVRSARTPLVSARWTAPHCGFDSSRGFSLPKHAKRTSPFKMYCKIGRNHTPQEGEKSQDRPPGRH